ncbi:hypothetical protein HYFRA_00007832 [Hymenoscyphus fraxineus]|uniref:Uncharacterized protein n=1 Tax=Hymenoscyphus fraxineus TaxID=746836 RepID=A0A9N9KLP6_9HELO|nr:hypothetical protein HYFRA_00007832 [Hymenoscyphus fraxineus]
MRQIKFLLKILLFAKLAAAVPWIGPAPTSTSLTLIPKNSEFGVRKTGVYQAEVTAPPGVPMLQRRDKELSLNYCGYLEGNKVFEPAMGGRKNDKHSLTSSAQQTPHSIVKPPIHVLGTRISPLWDVVIPSLPMRIICGKFETDPTSVLTTVTGDEGKDLETAQQFLMGSKELGLNPTATTTARLTVTEKGPSVPIYTQPPASPTVDPLPPHHHSVNTGTLVGATVGSSIFGLLAASVLAFFYIRRRNEKRRLDMARNQRIALAHTGVTSPPPSELPALTGGPKAPPAYAELPQNERAAELAGNREHDEETPTHHELEDTSSVASPLFSPRERQYSDTVPLVGGPAGSVSPMSPHWSEIQSASQMSLTLRELERDEVEHSAEQRAAPLGPEGVDSPKGRGEGLQKRVLGELRKESS